MRAIDESILKEELARLDKRLAERAPSGNYAIEYYAIWARREHAYALLHKNEVTKLNEALRKKNYGNRKLRQQLLKVQAENRRAGKFLVFAYHDNPRGGWGDFRKEFDTLEEAQEYGASLGFHYVDVVNLAENLRWLRHCGEWALWPFPAAER